MLRPYRHQSLWHGCIGAWCPSQAHSGGTLIDYSPMENHGTLTNMDPATDWVTSDGGWALDFDGVNDHLRFSLGRSVAIPLTLSCWFLNRSASNQAIFHVDASALIYYGLGISANAPYIFMNDGSSNVNVTGSTVSGWTHVAAVSLSATDHRLYVNGVQAATGSTSRNASGLFVDIATFRGTTSWFNGLGDDYRLYNRSLTESELRLLATRRGIAYERKPRLWAVKGAASGGGSFTLTAEAGAFNETGQEAQLEKGFLVTGELGTFNETGQAANLLKGYTTTFDVGSFTEAGQDANLLATRRISIDAGTFSVSGQDATLTKTSANSLAADVGSFALVGQDANTRIGRRLVADAASFVLTGQDANLSKGRTLIAEAGSFNETGQDALLRRTARLAIDAASFTFTGQNAQLTFAGGGLVPAPYYYQMMMGG